MYVELKARKSARLAQACGHEADKSLCRLKLVDIHDSLSECLGSFLRQIMSDAAGNRPLRVFAGEFVRVSTWLGMRRPIGIPFKSNRGHGDDRGSGQTRLQFVVFGLA